MEVLRELCARAYGYCDCLNESARHLRAIADELDALQERLQRTRIASASIGVAGGATAIVAGIVTICTLGLAAPITAPLVVAGVAGGVSAAASVAALAAQGITKLLESSQMEEAKGVFNRTTENMKYFEWYADAVNGDNDGLSAELQNIPTKSVELLRGLASDALNIIGNASQTISNLAVQAGAIRGAAAGTASGAVGSGARAVVPAAAKGAAAAGKLAAAAGVVFGVVGVGIDIWQIVDAGMELAKKNPKRAAQHLRNMADTMDNESYELRQAFVSANTEQQLRNSLSLQPASVTQLSLSGESRDVILGKSYLAASHSFQRLDYLQWNQ